jgi:hypothetical protein
MRPSLLALLLIAPTLLAQHNLPSRETLQYRAEWRLITAGRVRLDWSQTQHSSPGWEVKLHMESVGLLSTLHKVDNTYTANLNGSLCAESTQLAVREGSKQRDSSVTFDYRSRRASYLERDRVKNQVVATHDVGIPGCVYDVVGGLYQLRTANIQPGQSGQFPVSDGKRSVNARVDFLKREDVKTPAGSFKTVKYEVFLFNDVLYRRPATLYVWLTDDARKLPVQVQIRFRFVIGTVTLQLEKAEYPASGSSDRQLPGKEIPSGAIGASVTLQRTGRTPDASAFAQKRLAVAGAAADAHVDPSLRFDGPVRISKIESPTVAAEPGSPALVDRP